jgi:hypothetical protein
VRGARLYAGTAPIRTLVTAPYIAHWDPPPGVSPGGAAAGLRDVLDPIGDACPECPDESLLEHHTGLDKVAAGSSER